VFFVRHLFLLNGSTVNIHFYCTLSTALGSRFSDSLKTVFNQLLTSKLKCELIVVGKTVESYRMALESEITRWNDFDRALRKEDREAFGELMDMCRSFAMAAGNATNPILFEPMVMSHFAGTAETDLDFGKETEHKPKFTKHS
jgi:hypothetical protein